MSNLTDNIKIKIDEEDYHIRYLRASITIENLERFNINYCESMGSNYIDEMKAISKAKIIGYLYGNIIKRLSKFKHNNGRTFSVEMFRDMDDILDDIMDGSIIDEGILEDDR